METGGATWLSKEGWMFGGELFDSQVEPMVVAAAAMIDALMRVSQTRPTLLLPAHGDAMRSHVNCQTTHNTVVWTYFVEVTTTTSAVVHHRHAIIKWKGKIKWKVRFGHGNFCPLLKYSSVTSATSG
jgi:hypothetical protein